MEARAFVELITHVENCLEDGIFYFKFSSLRELYQNLLRSLGINKEINKVRFKERVLEYFPNAQQQNDRKNLVLVFEQGMQQMLKNSMQCQENAVILMKAARIVRDDILSSNGFTFNASFQQGCQQDSVPTTLKLLVTMIIKGADITDQDFVDSQACLSIAQTIVFNCKKTIKKSSFAVMSRHSAEYEPPLPLYIGLNVHTLTRSKKLIMELHALGLS